MLNIYKARNDGSLHETKDITTGVWINAVAPNDQERALIMKKTGIPESFLLYGLDPDEGARFEYDDDYDANLIIYDMPTVDINATNESYETIPLAMITNKNYIVTIHNDSLPLLQYFAEGKDAGFNPRDSDMAAMHIVYQISVSYLSYLRDLNKERVRIEHKLQKTLRNDELYGLMGIQRSLVYFMMSLRTNRIVLDTIHRGNQLHLSEDDLDYLDDITIENQQAIEMAQISNSIIRETADTYSSVINNNMNGVMKFLTSYSIILTIPTLVFSFYGMNMKLPVADQPWSWVFSIIVSILIGCVLGIQFWRRHFF
ncbi:magnesium transporter CorA family protein [Lacticaseibacillus zhaodongensis]|uniref:magnesium transporter CorA family protein n=1 Tax=Lacticaseibacillus zhaodongensis TaxID=2668065 RepID=UPI0012D32615|nr:magnesium transporter CorA family protein [Lacticaseibacillus zhaodongensis]